MSEDSPTEIEAAILLVDISGSTKIFEGEGDAAAVEQIVGCLEELRQIARRHGGMIIHSKGDDVLSAFPDPPAALAAAREMLSRRLTGPLAIHAGLHFGPVIQAYGELYGDSVNLTARLMQMANPGEVLVSGSFMGLVPDSELRSIRVLDNVTFKGKSAPTEIYSLLANDESPRTEVAHGHGTGHTRTEHQKAVQQLSVALQYGAADFTCSGTAGLSIGRSSDCDIVIPRPWVSRRHATVSVRRGKVELSDQSSSGTYVALSDGYEFFMRRETVLLIGTGRISPSRRANDAEAQVITFEIER